MKLIFSDSWAQSWACLFFLESHILQLMAVRVRFEEVGAGDPLYTVAEGVMEDLVGIGWEREDQRLDHIPVDDVEEAGAAGS
jgi:hypothetical protein